MLQNTFCHLPGVGIKTEYRLWKSGILSWQDLLKSSATPKAPPKTKNLAPLVQESIQALNQKNSFYFSRMFPKSETWRLFPQFKNQTAYLDIETTGLGNFNDHITSIAIYDGKKIKTFVHGENLEEFADSILNYKLIVTYNGSCFDLPCLQQAGLLDKTPAHIDLRFLLKRLGYTGGLKKCEKHFRHERGDLVELDGYAAVLLWQEYTLTDDPNCLETLLAYNVEDVLSLELLMHQAYNLKIKENPFFFRSVLPLPEKKNNPFQGDKKTIQRIKKYMSP